MSETFRCSQCGKTKSSSEKVATQVKVLSGSSDTTHSRRTNGFQRTETGHSHTDHYSMETRYICKNCSFKNLLFVLAAFALMAAVVAFVLTKSTEKTSAHLDIKKTMTASAPTSLQPNPDLAEQSLDTVPTKPVEQASSVQDAIPPDAATTTWFDHLDTTRIALHYPKQAEQEGVEGTASIYCVVIDPDGHVSCKIISESPEGYGFGAAAKEFLETQQAQSGSVVGSHIRTTLKFQLG